jgi:hypothetical protein
VSVTTALPDHLSHSTLIQFQSCPRRWSYKQAGFPAERRPAPLAFGIAIHEAVAHRHEAAFRGADDPLGGQRVFLEAWRASVQDRITPLHLGPSTNADHLEQTGLALLDIYQPPSDIVGVEQPITVHLADDLPPVVGRIDLLRQGDGETLVLQDVKTAGTRQLSDPIPTGLQLSLYADAYPAARLEAVVLAKLKSPVVTTQPIEPWPWERVVTTYREVYHAMRAGVRYAVRSVSCASCPHRDRCQAEG